MKKLLLLLIFVVFVSKLSTKGQSRLFDSLTICYPFENDYSDLSGNGFTALPINGPTFIKDRFGRQNAAIRFDGVNDYVSVSRRLPDMVRYSISVWIKLGQIGQGHSIIFMDADVPGGNDLIFDCASTGIGIRCDKNGDPLEFWQARAVPFNLDTNWHHIAWVSNLTSQKVFIDGVLRRTIQQRGRNIGYHANQASLGCLWLNDQNIYPRRLFYQGAMDEFKLYSRALTDTEVLTIYNYSAQNVTAVGATRCGQGPVDITASGGYRYEWYRIGNPQLLGQGSTLTIQNQNDTLANYTVRIYKPDCSVETRTVSVNIFPIPDTPTISKLTISDLPCKGDSIILTASPESTFLWSTGSSNQSISPSQSGSYSVRILGANGCVSPPSIPVIVDLRQPIPVDYLISEKNQCGFPIALFTTKPDSVSLMWTTPLGNAFSTDTLDATMEGTFYAEFQFSPTCKIQDSIRVGVLVPQQLLATVSSSNTGYVMKSDTAFAFYPVRLEAKANLSTISVDWSLNGVNVSQDSIYYFNINNSNPVTLGVSSSHNLNCLDSSQRQLTIMPIEINNIITLNNDLKNEKLLIPGVNENVLASIRIFNRWGQLVLESSDYENTWPSVDTPAGVYFYRAIVEAFGEQRALSGWAELTKP